MVDDKKEEAQEEIREENIVIQKINRFSESNYFIYTLLILFLSLLLSVFIRVNFLETTIFNFLNLIISIFLCFFLFNKIKILEEKRLSKKSVFLLFGMIIAYNGIFGMLGTPSLYFLNIGIFNNLIFYTFLSYIFFLYFFMKKQEKYSLLFFQGFIGLLVLDLILPFILVIFKMKGA